MVWSNHDALFLKDDLDLDYDFQNCFCVFSVKSASKSKYKTLTIKFRSYLHTGSGLPVVKSFGKIIWIGIWKVNLKYFIGDLHYLHTYLKNCSFAFYARLSLPMA